MLENSQKLNFSTIAIIWEKLLKLSTVHWEKT
jgi:hypothetical protein